MSGKKFKFQLQPALDKAEGEQRRCEAALVEAKSALNEALAELERREKKVAATTQQIAAEHDHLVVNARRSATPQQLLERDELLRGLRGRLEAEKAAVAEQQDVVALCQQKVKLRQKELGEAMMKVKAIEKLRDKALQHHQKQQQRALQNEIDEAGIQRSIRRSHD